ncbi:hypothetical protein HG535_0A04060 [Zygotorulaspora mrakii]|uniref:Vacuolar ATPase assembly protein VMA22 n=1 Tax=Zygotorulaspora mrakii TaxID=42260 RepID=A0A7H9AVV0_ZYGMR|nr:uncharacterized protein HG535_0A04060 [Zygotorulaspora mrakii]QLG70466.1 hypothetical protein HG535_0A04060 [Zygotorulaspora mrakii]
MTKDMMNDDSYIGLLKLLAKYDLLLEQFQKSMADGFYNLGRANYHNKDSLRGRYGMDYWDRSYEGQLVADIDGRGDVNITKREIIDTENEEKSEASNSQIRRRNRGDNEEKKKKFKQTDPLSMFGGSLTAPMSLRQSQSNFKSGIPLMVELINCKNSIHQLVKTIGED